MGIREGCATKRFEVIDLGPNHLDGAPAFGRKAIIGRVSTNQKESAEFFSVLVPLSIGCFSAGLMRP